MILELYLAFVQISLLSFGGGYAALPIIQDVIVDQRAWINMSTFIDILTISQLTPGPISINAATFVGTHLAGTGGALAATLGFVSPSLLITLGLSVLYQRYRGLRWMEAVLSGLRPAVIALIGAVTLGIAQTSLMGVNASGFAGVQVSNLFIMGVSLYLLRIRKLDILVVLLISGGLALIFNVFAI
jgi:chromate transporter